MNPSHKIKKAPSRVLFLFITLLLQTQTSNYRKVHFSICCECSVCLISDNIFLLNRSCTPFGFILPLVEPNSNGLAGCGGVRKSTHKGCCFFTPLQPHPSHHGSFESQLIRLVVPHRSDGIPSSLRPDLESLSGACWCIRTFLKAVPWR
jgi:hypothetical protein